MVVASWLLNKRYFPTPYDMPRIAQYVVVGLALFVVGEYVAPRWIEGVWLYGANAMLFGLFILFAVRRERIDVGAMMRSVVKRK